MSDACIPRALVFDMMLLLPLGPMACDLPFGDDPLAPPEVAAAPLPELLNEPVKLTVPILEALYTGAVAARLVESGGAQWDPEVAKPLPPGDAATTPTGPSSSTSAPPKVRNAGPSATSRSARARSPTPVPASAEADPMWALPASPEALLWRHPPDDDGFSLDLLDGQGQPWPSRVRLHRDDVAHTAHLEPLMELAPGAEYRVVARHGATTSSHAWSVTLQLPAP